MIQINEYSSTANSVLSNTRSNMAFFDLRKKKLTVPQPVRTNNDDIKLEKSRSQYDREFSICSQVFFVCL